MRALPRDACGCASRETFVFLRALRRTGTAADISPFSHMRTIGLLFFSLPSVSRLSRKRASITLGEVGKTTTFPDRTFRKSKCTLTRKEELVRKKSNASSRTTREENYRIFVEEISWMIPPVLRERRNVSWKRFREAKDEIRAALWNVPLPRQPRKSLHYASPVRATRDELFIIHLPRCATRWYRAIVVIVSRV